MITGSHNPPEYNGFKTVCGPGTLHGAEIQNVYKLIASADFESGEGSVKQADAVTPYIDEIASQFRFERKVRVVLDAGNGTAGPVVHRLFDKLNVDANEMFFDMDGTFPDHHPDPTVLSNLQHLQAAVRDQNAELGIAFDGIQTVSVLSMKMAPLSTATCCSHLRPRDPIAQTRFYLYRRGEMLAGDV